MILAVLLACGAPAPEPPAPEPLPTLFRLAADGAVQTWVAGDETVTLDTTSGRLSRGEVELKARSTWPAWQTLALCLGDPMTMPPAGDPAGFRVLAWDDPVHWRLELSGANTCQATGTVILDAVRDEVDVGGLLIDGRPWREGGRERGHALALQAFRGTLVDRWPELSERERSEALLLLQNDPDPEAAAVLRELTDLAGSRLPDVEAALANRPVQGPASAR